MTFRPPFFSFVLALLGACLVVWGAKGVVLNIPGLQTISLFEVSRALTWVVIGASVSVVGLSWLRPAWTAWFGWMVAVGALAYMGWDQWSTLQELAEKFAQATAEGMTMPDINKMLKGTEIRPGAISVLAGLVIQFVGLCLRRRPAGAV